MDRINILVLGKNNSLSFIESFNFKEFSTTYSIKLKFHQVYDESEFFDIQLDPFNIVIANAIEDLSDYSVKEDDFNYIFLRDNFQNQKIFKLGITILIAYIIGGRYINFDSDIFEFLDGIKSNNVFFTETEWFSLSDNKYKLLKYQTAASLNLTRAYRENVFVKKDGCKENIFHFVFFENAFEEDLDTLIAIREASETFLVKNNLMLGREPNISIVDFNSIWNSTTMEKQDRFKLITVIF